LRPFVKARLSPGAERLVLAVADAPRRVNAFELTLRRVANPSCHPFRPAV
jgi:hypothetical protein